MGWQIDLFRVPPGVDPRVVRDAQCGEEEHESYVIRAVSEETDRWIEHVVGLLEVVAPGLKIVDCDDGRPDLRFDRRRHIVHVQVWQPEGPLIANVYPECVDVKVNTSHPETRDGEWFDALWSACRILAEQAECAVFPQFDADPTDMTQDPKDARRLDPWA